jgi:cell division protein FtsW (lipid II flippase)
MDKQKIKIILFTWSMNMLIVFIAGFFPKLQAFMNARGLFNIIVILYLFKDFIRLDKISKSILVFVFYLFILCFFSSNMRLSFIMTIKTSIGMLMFLVGYRFFFRPLSFNKLLQYFKYLFILMLLTIAFSNITGIGEAGYGEEIENYSPVMFGSVGVAITKLLILPILIAPVYLYHIKQGRKKQLITILIFVGIILVIIAFKRSSTMGLVAGGLTYALLMKKRKIVKPVVYLCFIAFITFPIYQNYVLKSYELRQEQLYYISKEADDMEQEGRYWETINVIDAMKNDGIFHIIFGSEIFNEFDYFNTKRMLHIDFNVIANGSGLLGLFMFIIIYVYIIKKAWFYYKYSKREYLKLLSISVLSIVVFALFISIGGSVRAFDIRGPIFLYMGAAFGYIEYQLSKGVDNQKVAK